MSRYSDLTCIVCGNKFDNKQDIVVCPECGLPHHRDCYKSLGHCAMADKHGTAEQWTETLIENESEQSIICPKCSHKNNPQSDTCENCGSNLKENNKEQNNISNILDNIEKGEETDPIQILNTSTQLNDNEIIDEVSIKDLKLFLGKNYRYFLYFIKFSSKNGISIAMNLAAAIGGFIYYFYKKMYKLGALFLIFSLIINIPIVISTVFHVGVEYNNIPMFSSFGISPPPYLPTLDKFANILRNINWVIILFNGMFFNSLYKKHVFKTIKLIKAKQLPQNEYEVELIKKGGNSVEAALTSGLGVFLLLTICVLGLSYILGLI